MIVPCGQCNLNLLRDGYSGYGTLCFRNPKHTVTCYQLEMDSHQSEIRYGIVVSWWAHDQLQLYGERYPPTRKCGLRFMVLDFDHPGMWETVVNPT